MARKATIILDIEPRAGAADAELDRLARKAGGITLGGGAGASSGRGGGASGGMVGGRSLREEKAMLDQEIRLASVMGEVAKAEDLRTTKRALGHREAVAQTIERLGLETKGELLRKQAAKEAEAATKRQVALNAQARTQAVKFYGTEATLLKRLGDDMGALESRRKAALIQFRGNPAEQSRINQLYAQQREQLLQPPPVAPRTGFMGSVVHGWQKAGGVGEALGTVVKYGLVYKAIDLPLQLVNKGVQAVTASLVEGGQAWFDYEEQMANASRTMREPGIRLGAIKEVLGADALDFLQDYRVSMEEVAQAQYELGSANFSATQTLQAYETPLKVNLALMGNATQTTRVMTQMLKIHGEQMGDNLTDEEKMVRLGGILLKTWELEQVELSDLANAYKYVAGNAAALKIPAEELIPLLGFLSTYGLRGSIGGTGINQFFTQLAKNIEVTDGQITKLKKSAQGIEHVIDLKPGQYTPLDLLTQVSVAMQKINAGPAGRLQVAKVLSDMFNIRGARPALLLADLQRLMEYMGRVGDVSRMSVKDFQAYIDKMVEIRQNTPTAQLDIMRNVLYKTGVEFFQAAVGANTLTGALKNVNSFLRTVGESAGLAGAMVRMTFAGYADLLKITARTGGVGGGVLAQNPLAAVIGGTAGPLPFLMPGAKKGAADYGAWQRKQAVAKDYFQRRQSGFSPELARALARTAATNRGMPSKELDEIFTEIETEQHGLTMENWEKQMRSIMDQKLPEYSSGDSGSGGKGKTPQELADEYARDLMQAMEAKATVWELGVPGAKNYPWEWVISNLNKILTGNIALPGTGKAGIETQAQIAEKIQSIQGNLRGLDRQRKGLVEGRDIRNERDELRRLTLEREKLEEVTQSLGWQEQLYGESIGLTSRKIANAKDVQKALQAERDRAAANEANARKRYEDAKKIETALGAKPRYAMTPQELKVYEEAANDVDRYASELERAEAATQSLDDRLKIMAGQTIPMLNKGILDAVGKALTNTLDEGEEKLRKILGMGREAVELQRAFDDLRLPGEMEKTRLGWFRGTPAEMARNQIAGSLIDVDVRMAELRERFKTLPDAQGILNEYESVMRADAIMQPWLTARDRIEGEWTSMFQNVFAEAAQGNKDALWAGLDSIIKSLQGQMIQGWVKRNLGGLFDALASQEVGYSPVQGSAQASALALDGLTTQATLAASALGLIGQMGPMGGATGGSGMRGVPGGGILGTFAWSVANGVEMGIDNANKKSPKTTRATKPSAGSLPGLMQNYATASMFAGMAGSAMGYDPTSSGVAGGLGYAAGMALGLGPVGAIALGLASIFGFGKKKPKPPPEDPQRDIGGMPEWMWNSYLYNLTKHTSGLSLTSPFGSISSPGGFGYTTSDSSRPGYLAAGLSRSVPVASAEEGEADSKGDPLADMVTQIYSVGDALADLEGKTAAMLSVEPAGLSPRAAAMPVVANDNRSITINVNGGNLTEVRRVVDEALDRNFGALARANV